MKKEYITLFFKPHAKSIVFLFTLGLFLYLLPLAYPLLTKTAIDDVFIGSSDVWSLEKIILCFSCLYIASIAIEHVNNMASDHLTHNMMTRLKMKLFSHAQKLPKSYYDSENTGNIASRVNHDASDVSRIIQSGIISLCMNFIMMGVAAFILFRINGMLALVSLFVLPFYYVLYKKFNKKTRSIWQSIAKERGNVQSQLSEKLSGVSVIKNFHQEEREIHDFEGSLNQLRHENMRAEKASNLVGLITSGFNNGGNLLIWAVGGYMVLHKQMTVGELIAFQAYINSLYGPIRRLSSIQLNIQSALAAMERIIDFLAIPTEKTGTVRCAKLDGNIKVENLSFRYQNSEKETLKQISFEAKKGETIAFVGESGGGKSTLFQLLTRFYEENDGTIFVDNLNAKELHIGDLRKNMGIVSQDTFLFSGSVLENIRYGKPEATREEVIDIAKVVGAHHFIEKLENGYDTFVGERGVKLSGGQKQRISIARALLNNPSILLLDEATSALDTNSESIVVNALDHVASNTTKLVIAHRLSTILRADRIYVMDNGMIVEAGTHRELLEKKGYYAHLYDGQLKQAQ